MPTGVSDSALALSPPYWIPLLLALGMILTFLGAMLLALLKILVQPLLHTLDQTNETMLRVNETLSEFKSQMSVLIDRMQR